MVAMQGSLAALHVYTVFTYTVLCLTPELDPYTLPLLHTRRSYKHTNAIAFTLGYAHCNVNIHHNNASRLSPALRQQYQHKQQISWLSVA